MFFSYPQENLITEHSISMVKRNNNDAQTTVRMSKDLKNTIDEHAARSNLSLMEWIRRACEEKIQREKTNLYQVAEPAAGYNKISFIESLKKALGDSEIQKIIVDIVEKKEQR